MFNLNRLDISPSCTLLYFYIGVHLLCFFSLLYASIPALTQIILSFIICSSFIFSFRNNISLQAPLSIRSISWNADQQQMSLIQLNGVRMEVINLKQVTVFPFGVFLWCEVEERLFNVPVMVMRDSCNQDAFRRLRVLAIHATVASET